jgi:hypothetical protein
LLAIVTGHCRASLLLLSKGHTFSIINILKLTTMQPTQETTTLPACLAPHLQTIKEIVSLFPPGEMEQEIWQIVFALINIKEEELPQQLKKNMAQSFILLQKLCRAMQGIADGMEAETV